MKRSRVYLTIGLVGLAAVGVGGVVLFRHNAPLGTLTQGDVAAWERDCAVPIVEEDPHAEDAPGPLMRDGGPAFKRATRRYRCPPPGWAIYTDSGTRIVGLCVDDELQYPNYGEKEWQEVIAGTRPSSPRVSEVDRARKLITAHWGRERASEMLQGVARDHCSLDSQHVAGMVRWDMGQFISLEYRRMPSQDMCCWEVSE